MRSPFLPLATLILAVGLVAAAPDPAAEAVKRGRNLFRDTQDVMYPSCGHCHNTVPEAEEAGDSDLHLGPATTLYGAAIREGWRNRSTYGDVGEALQYCAKTWQERPGGFGAAQVKDLVAYLRTIAPKQDSLPRRKVEKKPKFLRTLGGGDATLGGKIALRFCGGCHNGGRDALSYDFKPGRKRADLIARKVRGYDAKGKFKPQEGTMSYYTTNRLSDEELRHILAWLAR